MTDLFDMLSTIARRRKSVGGSPFASAKATEKWLKTLPTDSDYDVHHALVEGLERFNAENEAATVSRLRSLMKLEEAGLPLQLRIIEQYVRNQASFRLARQALWRESWVFWSLMAEAWLNMLKQAYRGPASAELKPFAAEIATRALRYAGLVMRWDYHQARDPAASAWRRVHKIYRLVERDGFATQKVRIDGRTSHCAREYAQVVLMGLVHPLGYRTQEIESVAQLIESYEPMPLPQTVPLREVHTHMVDLSTSEGASMLDNDWVQGRRLRYFALRPFIDYLKSLEGTSSAEGNNGLALQAANLIERGGVRRDHPRAPRFGRAWVAVGMGHILAALGHSDEAKGGPDLKPWMLRDESAEGMGFSLSEDAPLPNGHLVAVSWDPSGNAWQLLAIRWKRVENGQHRVGAQSLSSHPKRVEIYFHAEEQAGAQEKIWAVFMPMTPSGQGLSNLLIPKTHYCRGAALKLRDGESVYQLRLGEVKESHEDWVRVDMDVVGREQFAAAA